jgi:hypothetical protein
MGAGIEVTIENSPNSNGDSGAYSISFADLRRRQTLISRMRIIRISTQTQQICYNIIKGMEISRYFQTALQQGSQCSGAAP